MALQRIVVGTDLELDGDVALREARSIAERIGAYELHVVHVLGTRRDHDTEELSRALNHGLDRLRDRVRAVLGEADFGEVKLHVRFGEVAAALQQVAVDHDADMIVVGTHARRGVARAVLGSVAEALVRTAHVPVLVAREKDFTGISKTAMPDPKLPAGAQPHTEQMVSGVVRIGPRTSHISGLV